jgi:TolB-like protein
VTFSLSEVARLTGAIATALDTAHQQGVIHRDLKPENILLTADGLPLVADFGIALAVKHAGGERLTETGMSLGTPAYMSPEQVAGTRELDGRSDIYSLGCLAFELLSGHPPYQGATAFAVMTAHITEPIPPVTSPREPVPAAASQAIRRALAKDPAERFARAGELAAALAATNSGPQRSSASAEPVSILVLPFGNLSPDPENAFFADGLTEEVIGDLSKIRALRVISRTTAMGYKGTTRSVPAIARELNVRYVLEGNVRRAGNALRVSAQLVDASSDSHVWSDKYAGTLEDVFEIQEKLAREITGALRVTLTPAEARRVKRTIDDPEAYDWYLRARQLVFTVDLEAFEEARVLLHRAQGRVGDHPLLLASMGYRHMLMVMNGADPDLGSYDKALALSGRAIALDPECVEAHTVIGVISMVRGRVEDGAGALRRALEIDPNHVDALSCLVWLLAKAGRMIEAKTLGARLATIGHHDPVAIFVGINIPLYDGRIDEAIALLRDWERSDPHQPYMRFAGLTVLAATEDARQAADWAAVTARDVPLPTCILYHQACERLTRGGMKLTADWTSENEESLRHDFEFCWSLASLLAANDERDEAVAWLRQAVHLGLFNYPFLSEYVPHFRLLAGYPPYDRLMDEVKHRWETFSA